MTTLSSGSVPDLDSYDRLVGRYGHELAGRFLKVAGVSRESSILEVGCGTGVLTQALGELVDPRGVTVVDRSKALVAACRNRVPEVAGVAACGESLPFASASFDAVLSQLVLNWLDDPHATARETRRVARRGAIVAACVWDYHGGVELTREFWDAAKDLGLPNIAERDPSRWMPFCTRDELRLLWGAADLVRVETGEILVAADYLDFADLWGPLEAAKAPSSIYLRSLVAADRKALRANLFARLGRPTGSFCLTARALWVRGRRP